METNCFDQILNIRSIKSECITYLFAKSLGTLIFFLSFTLKIPQIFTIYKTKSTKGISSFSIYSDFISTVFQGLYCFHKGLPMSIYSEYISIVLQNFNIVLLYWYYAQEKSLMIKIQRIIFLIFLTIFCCICLVNNGEYIPPMIWELMAASNIPFVTVSRFTQIWTIVRSKCVGAVSISSFFMRFMKNILKIISLLLETTNLILLINQSYNAFMSISVVIVIIYYKNSDKVDSKSKED